MSTVARRKPKIVLGPELNGTLITPDEFDAVEEYDDNYVFELIHGVLVVNPIPLESEVGPNEYLGHLLLAYWERGQPNSPLDATLPERYIRTKYSRRRADRLIWAGLGRMPDWKKDLPSVAVEFVSPAAGTDCGTTRKSAASTCSWASASTGSSIASVAS